MPVLYFNMAYNRNPTNAVTSGVCMHVLIRGVYVCQASAAASPSLSSVACVCVRVHVDMHACERARVSEEQSE